MTDLEKPQKKKEMDLLINIIYYALFKKELLDYTHFSLPSSFGVFVTIRRTNILSSWPKDIHGCIGYWTNNFTLLSNKELYTQLCKVSYDAMYSDDRRKYFSLIETDPLSVLEIDFMKSPIIPLDNKGNFLNSQKKFNNKTHGIIIKSNGNRATYLPNVFENMSWSDMIVSIKKKAGITTNKFDLFAYKIKQIKAPLISLLQNNILASHHYDTFYTFLINSADLSKRFPFIYHITDTGNEIWNKDETVRNISTMANVLYYIQQKKVKQKIDKRIEEHLLKNINSIIANIKKYDSQALSFLGYYITLNKSAFCKKLSQDILSADKEFAVPEIAIGLLKAQCKTNQVPDRIRINDSIFHMNWILQHQYVYGMKTTSTELQYVIKKIKKILKKETNYLAVAFEGLCAVYKSTKDMTALITAFEVFYNIEKRINIQWLYTFFDGSARIDITEHMLHGFQLLQ